MSRPADIVLGYAMHRDAESTKRLPALNGRHRTFSRFSSAHCSLRCAYDPSFSVVSDISENKAESDLLLISVFAASMLSKARQKARRAVSLFSKFSGRRGRLNCTRS